MSVTSKRVLLGMGLAGLILESVIGQSALATDKVSLFKVITARDEIVIGLSDDELSQLPSKTAGGVAKVLVDKGMLDVWQYGVRRGESGGYEQRPLRKIGLMSNKLLRIEPYTSPLRVVPISYAATQ